LRLAKDLVEDYSINFSNRPNSEGRSDGSLTFEYSFDQKTSLPDSYGDHRLVILPRDPFWFFAYWEVSENQVASLRSEHGADIIDRARWVLRVYDVSDAEASADGGPFVEIEIGNGARQWYVKVARPGRAYQAHLGLRLPDGKFIVVLVSNRIKLPRGRISDETDSRWMAVGYGRSENEKWERLLDVSGANEIGRGSAEIARTMAQRWEFLKSVFSGSSSSWSSSAIPQAEKK
jgi:hypothetical protein